MNRATRSWSGMRECTMVQLITCIYPIFIDYSNSQLFAARVMDKGLSNSMICGWGLTACSAHHKWLGLSCCWSRLMGRQRGTGRAVLAGLEQLCSSHLCWVVLGLCLFKLDFRFTIIWKHVWTLDKSIFKEIHINLMKLESLVHNFILRF